MGERARDRESESGGESERLGESEGIDDSESVGGRERGKARACDGESVGERGCWRAREWKREWESERERVWESERECGRENV